MNLSLKDSMFAIVTPFTDDGENIDYSALEKYLNFLQEKGVQTIITGGTTGEFASLTLEERKELLTFCRRHFNGKIVNHIGTSSMKDTIALLEFSSQYSDAVISLAPYYYANAEEEGIYQYFRAILQKTSMPFYLYNFPKHTQITITKETILKLKEEFPHLAGIKDSSGDFALSKLYHTTGVEVFVGSDTRALETINEGMSGNAVGGANVVPEFLVEIVASYRKNDVERAKRFFEAYKVWNSFRKSLGVNEIALIKCGLAFRIENFPMAVRLPLMPLNDDKKKMIHEKIEKEILPKLEQMLAE